VETHVKILGWLYIVLGLLGIISAAIVFVAVAGGGIISGDRQAIIITSIVAICVGGFLLLVSAPGIIAGIGLINFKPWARVLTLVLGFLNLPGLPVGTALGIYTLWVLLQEKTTPLFENAI